MRLFGFSLSLLLLYECLYGLPERSHSKGASTAPVWSRLSINVQIVYAVEGCPGVVRRLKGAVRGQDADAWPCSCCGDLVQRLLSSHGWLCLPDRKEKNRRQWHPPAVPVLVSASWKLSSVTSAHISF